MKPTHETIAYDILDAMPAYARAPRATVKLVDEARKLDNELANAWSENEILMFYATCLDRAAAAYENHDYLLVMMYAAALGTAATTAKTAS